MSGDDQERRNRAADHRRAVEDADRERPLVHREPLRDDLVAARVVAALARAEPEAEEAEMQEGVGHRVQGIGDRPPHDREGQPDTCAAPVHQPAHRELAEEHPHLEGRDDDAVLRVREAEDFAQLGRGDRQRLTVHEVDHGDAEEHRQDPPPALLKQRGHRQRGATAAPCVVRS